MKRIFGVLLIVALLASWSLEPIRAQMACSASVSPGEAAPGEEELEFSFSITNTGSEPITWMRIRSPHPEIEPWSVSLRGWDIASSGDSTVFRQNTLAVGETVLPKVTPQIIPAELVGFSGSWLVEVSANSDGSGAASCSGSLGFTVTGDAPDSTGPVISSIVVSDITASSAKVSWSTNESASALVRYDVNPDADPFAFSQAGSGTGTSHSVHLTSSIAANTAYHFEVCSTDGSGNQSCAGVYTFTSGAVGAAPVVNVVIQPTQAPKSQSGQIIYITPTPLPPTPTPDRVPPQVAWVTKELAAQKTAPELSVTARDNGAITKLDYTVDGGKSWQPIKSFSGRGSGVVRAVFTPGLVFDDTYELRVRATDAYGNSGVSGSLKLVLDTLPPLMTPGGVYWGAQRLVPEANGTIKLMAGLEYQLVIGSVGGAELVKVSANRVEPVGESLELELSKTAGRGIWKTPLKLNYHGLYSLVADSADGASNVSTFSLPTIQVVDRLKLIASDGVPEDLQLRLFTYNHHTAGFSMHSSVSINGNENGVETAPLWVEAGDYYLELMRGGRRLFRSSVLSAAESGFLEGVFTIETNPFWKTIFSGAYAISYQENESAGESIEDEKEEVRDLDFMLESLEGEQILGAELIYQPITFVLTNAWMPDFLSHLKWVEKNQPRAKLVLVQTQSVEAAKILKAYGFTGMVAYADPTGESVRSLGMISMPGLATFIPGSSKVEVVYSLPH